MNRFQISQRTSGAGILPAAISIHQILSNKHYPIYPRSHKNQPGFTLPAVLVVTGALLVLAVGILAMVSIDRGTSRSFVDRERAALAGLAGLEEVRALLETETANDNFLVIRSEPNSPIGDAPSDAARRRAPFLFIATPVENQAPASFRYTPLFSAASLPPDGPLAAPAVEPFLGTNAGQRIDFTALPHHGKARAVWQPVEDENGRVVARYAYWIEDLQGRIDPTLTGNDDGPGGSHERAAWPFPAAGINPNPPAEGQPALNQVPLFAFDPAASEENQGQIARKLFQNRELLVSPESSLAAAGIRPPLVRLQQAQGGASVGQLADPAARAIEESLMPGIRPYDELALVPPAAHLDSSVIGRPKLNLNRLLATGGDGAVTEMADFIAKGLPRFESRKGGFPEDYLKTLAASAIDYADLDSEPTVKPGEYRGIDAYPLVSEFLMTFKWTGVRNVGNRKVVEIRVSTFVELWNMTNLPVEGEARVSYETGFTFPLGAIPDVSLADLEDATPELEQIDGYPYFPPMPVSLRPNQYQVYRCGEITYQFDAGPASVSIASPLILTGETFGVSGAGYRLRWNGQLVDQSRGGVNRNNINLAHPVRPATRATVPAHSYKTGLSSADWINNMGDPRMCYVIQAPQDANSFPTNYSPNRRNVRFGTIYGSDASAKPKIHGRVMPSEWPDGGHNSFVGTLPVSGVSETSDPDHPNFMNLPANSPLRNPPADEAPVRLSNAGRFYSVTELGRVFDPIMWDFAPPSSPNLPFGDVLSNTPSSTRFGGGNTLRIGRPEHPRFDPRTQPGLAATSLLDLFHTGIARSENAAEREGPLVRIEGHVNLNTAGRDALRALAYGALRMDPKIARRTSENHSTTGAMAPPVTPYKAPPAELAAEADRIADAIIRMRNDRPLVSPAAIAAARAVSTNQAIHGRLVFGNKDLITDGARIHRSDSAAEEVFARVFESSTVRSRNFRVWVVGQAIAPAASATASDAKVLAETRRSFTVFADPGERRPDGTIDPAKSTVRVLHENDF